MKKPNKKLLENFDIKLGFEIETIDISLDDIIPIKPIPKDIDKNIKFKKILSSIQEVGIIEPPAVSPDSSAKGKYILLDGHLRIEALRRLGIKKVNSLISKDDEAFTYNKFINRLSSIQEHKMILQAVERGVPEQKIAQALNVDVALIVRKKNLLDGICPEVVEMLKDKMVSGSIFAILKRLKPFRQIEVITMMEDAGIYSLSYARAFLAATPKNQLANPERPKRVLGLSEEQMSRMENEMAGLQREYSVIEENYSTDVLNLTLAKGYLGSLLNNARIVRYLSQNHPEILKHFQKITEMISLKDKAISS